MTDKKALTGDFILIVEDDRGTNGLEARQLAPLGLAIRSAFSGKEAAEILKDAQPALMLLDYSLPDMNAFGLLEVLHENKAKVPPFIVITGLGDEKMAVELMKAGAEDYLVKDSSLLGILCDRAIKALNTAGLRSQLTASRYALSGQIKLTADIINSCSAPICTFDLSGKYTSANMAAARILKTTPEALIGRRQEEFMPAEMAAKYSSDNLQILKSGKAVQFEEMHIESDGQHFYSSLKFPLLDEKGETYGIGVIDTDITERKKAERFLQEMTGIQRAESLGALAGGIAHDFNNMLTGISANMSLLAAKTANKEHKEIIRDALEAARDAQTLTGQLMAFSKGGKSVKKVFCFETALRETFNLATRGAKHTREIKISDGLWSVEGDGNQLKQAVSNLLVNALLAMPDGGMLRLTAENVRLTDGAGGRLPAGNYVRVIVTDTGSGIPKESLESVFEPYPAANPRGDALGLAITWSVINGHGGNIEVESDQGKGAAFKLLLPATGTCIIKRAAGKTAEVQTGVGRILVLEDEEMVSKAAERILKALGYSCEITTDGAETLRRYAAEKAAGSPFDAVIMDLTIPGGMGGKEAVQLLRGTDPGARIMVSSGYSDEPVLADYKAFGFDAVLPKPYRYEDMSAALALLLKKG